MFLPVRIVKVWNDFSSLRSFSNSICKLDLARYRHEVCF